MKTVILTPEEYSNIIATIQFLQNKSERLEREKLELSAELAEQKHC